MILSEVLFNCKKDIRCCQDAGGTTYTTGAAYTEYHSKARPASVAATKAKAKISRVGLLLDKLLVDQSVYLASINEGDLGYAEYGSSDGEIYAGVYDGTRVKWLNGKAPDSNTGKLAPVFAYALGVNGGNNQTNTDFSSAVSFFETVKGNCSIALLVTLCDTFYYEFAKPLADAKKDDIDESIPLTEEELNQLNRTKSVETLCDIGASPTYINISDAPMVSDSDDENFEKIKSGEYYIGYEWSEEQQKKIPKISYLDNFVPTPEYYKLFGMIKESAEKVLLELDTAEGSGEVDMDAIIKNNYINTIMVGKPGTGKTSVAYALGASLGIPVYTVVNSRNTEEDNYEVKNKVVDGKITFCPTPFLNAFKNGGIVVLEEFNLVSPDVIMGSIGQAVEAPFILMEDGYKEVKRHPLCFIIATMNTATQGSKEPNEAFTSRFPDTFLMDDPEDKDFIRILMSDGNSDKDSANVYNAYRAIIDRLTADSLEDIAMSLTMRHCLATLKAMRRGTPFKEAVKRCIVNAIGIKDIKIAAEIYEGVVEPMVVK